MKEKQMFYIPEKQKFYITEKLKFYKEKAYHHRKTKVLHQRKKLFHIIQNFSQGRMYVSGGRCDYIIHKAVYMYDENSMDQWQRLADMLVPRHLHEMASDGTQIYTCGGHPELSSCERFDYGP